MTTLLTPCDELFDRVNARFANQGEGVTHSAPNGECYVTLTSGGIKDEGQPFPVWFKKSAAAVSAWWKSFECYAQTKNGDKVYWRWRPELIRTEQGFNVYSRLLVADT